MADKRFCGCGGLVITDEIRVTIAAEVSVILNKKGAPCTRISSPCWFIPPGFWLNVISTSLTGPSPRVSTACGQILEQRERHFSWDDVEKGAADFTDGHNVVFA